MTQMTKLLAIIGIVAAALLVAGCTSFGGQTPATTPTAAGTPAAAGTETVPATPVATGIETPAGATTATTTGIVTVTDTPAGSGTGSSTGSLTVLDEEMNESTVVVKLNSRFALELAENPSTGYAWNLTTSDGLRVVSDEYVAPGSGNAVGAAGTHRWEFDAIAEGLQQIDGVYTRSWEKTTSDEDTFAVEIAVEA